MFSVAIAHARCRNYRFRICMTIGFDKIGNFLFSAGLTSICRIAAFRTCRFGYYFRISMTESFHIAVLERITAVRTGMLRISLFRASGSDHLVSIGMSLFVDISIRILIAARCAEMSDISFVRACFRDINIDECMPEGIDKIVRIVLAALVAGVERIALLGTRCRNHFDCFKIMLARLGTFGICYRHRFCRHCFYRCTCIFFHRSATGYCKCCNKSDCHNRNKF